MSKNQTSTAKKEASYTELKAYIDSGTLPDDVEFYNPDTEEFEQEKSEANVPFFGGVNSNEYPVYALGHRPIKLLDLHCYEDPYARCLFEDKDDGGVNLRVFSEDHFTFELLSDAERKQIADYRKKHNIN